ncbi:site-2 protease family protein [Conexibacter sp. JD483]|uniref:M50 family metallopeptidase n=1 Tax=unclassified Conexibacter TaxID=2627773 RepID=UPI002723EFB1|nr:MULTISPECIES: site-2 protease family protein [unclassified Conexibacter]MDO8188825.1 site-2 protease family protein [Conexibacter sp. CPCC 205706]MDO8201167.1 site-2 protease family protein [Conexibacter sp. CPCC 205762]MDR9372743.1 site-2 protease family protein [Conexibacter sp. JD483]
MNYALAFVGFCALIVLHELGHFTAAKLVGMRVEKFSLFFGKPLAKVQKGETEYAVGWIPAGGYVRITGMNPNEEIPEEIASRAYYRMPVWKRIVVIAAGPLVNVVIAFLILWALLLANGTVTNTPVVSSQDLGQPAAQYLQPNDRVISVDGVRGDPAAIARQVATHRCAGAQVNGCSAATPASVVVERDGRLLTFAITPRYDGRRGIDRARLGFSYEYGQRDVPAGEAASLSLTGMWDVTTATVRTFAKLFQAREREQLSGVVGTGETLKQGFDFSTERALGILALISLSLAIINLFPFLPLDGGHIFWAIVEKLRGGRAVPFSVMEKAGAVGFVLVIMLFFIGLTNDIGRISDGTLGDIPR